MPGRKDRDSDPLTNEEKLPFVSRIPPRDLPTYVQARVIARRFNSKMMLDFLDEYARWATSAGGRGRQEIIDFEGAVQRAEMMGMDGMLDAPPPEAYDEHHDEEWEDEKPLSDKVRGALGLGP